MRRICCKRAAGSETAKITVDPQTGNQNNSLAGQAIGILAIQGDFEAHGKALAGLGVPFRLVKKAADLKDLAGLILPGGESTTLLKFFEIEKLWEPLQAFAAEHAVFGTCAGAILLAAEVENPPQRSLGLIEMIVRRNAFGRQIYSFIRHAKLGKELAEAPGNQAEVEAASMEAVFIRAPLILKISENVQILASLDGSPILVRQGRYLAATFHPELTDDRRIHRYFCQMAFQQTQEPSC